MPDSWRIKRYYNPRVLIGVSDTLESPYDDIMVCLTAGEANILRNLLQYASRRATWVSEYAEQYYLAPTTEEWDAIEAVVATLGEKLMTGCDDLLGKLDEILTAVACICPNLLALRTEGTLSPDSLDSEEVQDVFEWSDSIPNPSVPSEEEEAACAISQLWYQAGFEIITEGVIPASKVTFDVLLSVVAALIATMTEGVTLPALLGALSVADLVKELIEGAWDSAESNLYNFMVSAKQDIVCELYQAVQDGGTASGCWSAAYNEVISPSEDISALDKAILWLFMGNLGYVIAYLAYNADTAWAQGNVSSGYCESCPEEPVIGTDWCAVPVPAEYRHYEYYRPDGTSQLNTCLTWQPTPGYVCCGVVFEVTVHTGSGGDIKRMGPQGTCSWGRSLWDNQSEDLPVHLYDSINGGYIDEAEARAALAPGATHCTGTTRITSYDANGKANIQIGGYPAGLLNGEVEYYWLVFEGTTPPTVVFV
jgi:hypothetical protein